MVARWPPICSHCTSPESRPRSFTEARDQTAAVRHLEPATVWAVMEPKVVKVAASCQAKKFTPSTEVLHAAQSCSHTETDIIFRKASLLKIIFQLMTCLVMQTQRHIIAFLGKYHFFLQILYDISSMLTYVFKVFPEAVVLQVVDSISEDLQSMVK